MQRDAEIEINNSDGMVMGGGGGEGTNSGRENLRKIYSLLNERDFKISDHLCSIYGLPSIHTSFLVYLTVLIAKFN